MAWISPTGYSDPDSCWTNETKAYDGNIVTTAASTPFCNGFLWLTLSSTIASSKVKVWIGGLIGLWAIVEVYDVNLSSWIEIKNGNISNPEEISFATRNINKARFRGWSTWGDIISEFKFWENEITTSTSTTTSSTSTTMTSLTSTSTSYTASSTSTTTTLYPEQTLADTFPQHVRMHLGIRDGVVKWSALVNQTSFTVGERTITYDGASGTPDFLSYDAPYLVLRDPPTDSVPGLVKGYVKIVSMTASSPTEGTIVIENNSLNWENNDVLQVLDYVPLYARRAIHDTWPGWQTPYPVPIMGPHRAGFVNERLKFMAEDSYALKGRTVASYYWIFNGGRIVGQSGVPYDRTSVGGTRADPLYVYWTAAGEYIVELTVRDSGGAQYTSFRSVLIYDRSGENAPHDWIRLRGLQADWESGGASCSLEVFRSPTLADFPDHALAVLWAEEWYEDYEQSLGDELGAENILFVGYIVANSQTLDASTETVALQIATIDYLMDRLSVWPEQFKDDATPDGWDEFANMTLDDVAWHVLRQHTTVPLVHDIHSGITTRLDALDISEASSLGVLNDQIYNCRFGKIAATRLSNLYIAQDRQYEDAATQASHPFAMTISNQRWFETLDFGEERAPDQASQIELEGFTLDLLPVLSFAPPLDPAYPSEGTWGSFGKVSGILVDDVDEAAYLAGQALAVANMRYSRLMIQTGNWRRVDPARQDYLKLDMAAGATLRGHDWSSETIICRGFSWNSEPSQAIEGTPIVQGISGSYIALDPAVAPAQTLNFVVIVLQLGTSNVRAFFTSGFNDANVYWTEFSNGLETSRVYDLKWDPFNKYQVLFVGGYNGVFRWHSPLGQETKWSNVLTLSELNTLLGTSAGWYAAVRIETSERKQGFTAVHVVYPHPDNPTYLQSRVLVSLDWGTDWTASNPFTYSVSGSSQQYNPGVDHLCQFGLSGCRHEDGILYATVGWINPGAWKSILFRSTSFSTSFSQIGSVVDAPTQPYSRGDVHVPYYDNLEALIVYWAESTESGAGAPERVWKSTNRGVNFSAVGGLTVIPQTIKHPRVVDSHEKNHDRVIVYRSQVGGASGYWLTTDGGTSWVFRQICNGVAGSDSGVGILHDVSLWAPSQTTILAGGDSFVRVSTDDGVNWTLKNGDLSELLGVSSFKVLAVLPYW